MVPRMDLPNARGQGAGFLAKYLFVLRGYRRRVAGMVVLFLVMSLLDLVGIGMIGPFISAVTGRIDLWANPAAHGVLAALGASDATSAITLFGVALSVLYVLKGAFAYAVQRRIFDFAFRYRSEVLRRLVSAYLAMPYKFYLERNSAGIVQSVTVNTKQLADELLIPSLQLVSNVIVLVALFALLCWIDLTGVLVIVAMTGTALGLHALFARPRAKAAGKEVLINHEQIIKLVNQAIWGIKEVRTFGVERAVEQQVAKSTELTRRYMTKFYGLLFLPRYLMETVVMIAVIVISLMAILGRNGGADLVPNLAMFAVAGLRILPSLTQIGSSLTSINYTSEALTTIYNDLEFISSHPGEKPSRATPTGARKPFETLTLEHVSFRYAQGAPLALDDIDLALKRGQSIGLIGASGAGKTTLVDMLLGFHRPESGRILIDGLSMEDYGWENWRRQVAYLPQNMSLMDDTIERNIAFGLPPEDIDHARLARAIENAQLADFVRRLPEGIKTVVGERGVRLSGGEKQRIALARGFYFDRDIFILDEATAALDNETERQIIKVIEEFHGRKTMIVIAHRLSTVRNCDTIYRLEAGRIVRSGTFAEAVPELASRAHS